MELHTLKGVEIFETGDYGAKGVYTESDLDAMVAAAKSLNFNPPLKSGHVSDKAHATGAPALGWTENIRRAGSKLIADFVAMPKQVFEAVKARTYDRVSAEVFRNVDFKGQKYPAVLKAVGLLGAAMPQIPTLKPLHEMEFDAAWGTPVTVEFTAKGEPIMSDEIKALQDKLAKAEAEKAERDKALSEFSAKLETFSKASDDTAKALKEANDRIARFEAEKRASEVKSKVDSVKIPALRPFVAAFAEMCDSGQEVHFSADGKDPKAVKRTDVLDAFIKAVNDGATKALFTVHSTAQADDLSNENPSVELDAKVKKFMADSKEESYSVAKLKVLASDPDLKRRYAGVN